MKSIKYKLHDNEFEITGEDVALAMLGTFVAVLATGVLWAVILIAG